MDDKNNGWEVFDKTNVRNSIMEVRVYTDLTLALRKAVHDHFEADKVKLLYNASLKQIGIKQAKEDDETAFDLRQPNRQKSKAITARSFMKYYELEHLKGGGYPATWSEELNMIVVDVSKWRKKK